MIRILTKKDYDFLIESYHNYRRLKIEIDLLSYHNKDKYPILKDVEDYFKNYDGERLFPLDFKQKKD